MAVKGAKGRTGRIVVWALLGVLIVSLAGFGVTSFGGRAGTIGRVGDTRIEVDEYARALQAELRALQERTGEAVTMADAQAMGLDRNVLGQLVAQAALRDELDRAGLSVGDATLREELLSIPAFQGIDGRFDEEAYRFALDRNGLSVPEFEAELRADIAHRYLTRAVAGGVAPPATFVEAIFQYAAERRDLTVLTLGPDALDAPPPEPDAAAVEAFYEANPDRFTAPRTRAITYAWLSPDMVAGEVDVSDDALRQAYEARRDEYVQPERRLVERLAFGDEAAAQAAADAIAAGGTTFDALVEERGLTLADVDLGDVSREDLGDAADAVFAADEPGVVGPAPSPVGPSLYRVNAILAAQEVTFQEARDELREIAAADAARREVVAQSDDIDDRLAAGATLADLAQETRMELGRIDWHEGVSEGIAAYPAFREAAEATEPGDFPEVRRLSDGGIFALRVDEIVPPTLRPLDAVRDEARQGAQAAALQDALAERARALADQLRAGIAAVTLGPPVRRLPGLSRQGFAEDLPQGLIPTAFDLDRGGTAIVPGDGQVHVVRVDRIVSPEAADPALAAARQAIADQIAASIATDILQAYTRAIEAREGIRLDQRVIGQVNAQFP